MRIRGSRYVHLCASTTPDARGCGKNQKEPHQCASTFTFLYFIYILDLKLYTDHIRSAIADLHLKIYYH